MFCRWKKNIQKQLENKFREILKQSTHKISSTEN